jgi:NAD(P)-dependent dehydrogenase (short-subunit alcohol dehydrogenase family)
MKKVCLLTGAGGTLGNVFCRLHGMRYEIAAVYLHRLPRVPCQNQQFIDPLHPGATVEENDYPAYAIRANLAEDNDLAGIVDQVLARFGRIDLLVNAAVEYSFCSIADTDQFLNGIATQFIVNTVAPVKLASIILRNFWQDRYDENLQANRNIVNISSTSGLYIFPKASQAGYSASKAALNCLTLHMADEFSPSGIRVNAIAPTGFPRFLSTESVAKSIVRLDEGNITGKILVMEEGREWFA